MSILELRNVSQVKDGTTILRDVSASFPEGKITTILGRSGSGKSTLLRLLNELDSPSQGEILYQDRKLHQTPPTRLRRKIGMIPMTNTDIFPT